MRLFSAGKRRSLPPDETDETPGLDDTEALPVSPDEDMPVIPDDERVVDMPS